MNLKFTWLRKGSQNWSLALFLVLIICQSIVFAQPVHGRDEGYASREYPTVDKRCPDFLLQNIKYFSKKKAKLEDFNGKWLILDFWNKSCGGCIASFPHMNDLQKELNNKVQVMFVGIEDNHKEIEAMYSRFYKRENLVLPCAFDSAIAERFDIYTAPYIIIIDDKGIVRAITSSIHTKEMKDLMDGLSPRLYGALRIHQDGPPPPASLLSYNPAKPLGINNNGTADSSFLYRSMLSLWDGDVNRRSMPYDWDFNISKGRFEIMGASLETLYNYAYVGVASWCSFDSVLYEDYYRQQVLEIKDSSAFMASYDPGNYQHLYSYSLVIPREGCSKEKIQQLMREDLERYFGFKASVETRKCPCLKVVATEAARQRLRTKEKGVAWIDEGNPKISFRIKNLTFWSILDKIKAVNQGATIFDATEMTGKIDMNMDCEGCIFFNDVGDVKKALQKNGLDLVQGEKEMKVIVVKDK